MKDKNIRHILENLPLRPGVYKFLDTSGKVIYVGKAKNLRKRVSSYFNRGKVLDKRRLLLLEKIDDIKFVETGSESEALIFEAALIKEHRPLFNIELKDDKSYPFLKLTMNEEFPRLFITRRRLNDGASYYGPYVNVKMLRKAVSFMKKVFPLRSCRHMKKKVCLEFHIGQCEGPCEGFTDKKEYRQTAEELRQFLEGRKGTLMDELKTRMDRYSRCENFEKAIMVKERLKALSDVQRFHDQSKAPLWGELEELKHVLKLSKLPVEIECFDISNFKGFQSVGSMVFFLNGRPARSRYRKFRIKSVLSPDDYAMIREVVGRRYGRLIEEKKKLPDLVIIDGGKGHLAAAEKELKEMGADVPVASIAKEHDHIYISQTDRPVRLAPGRRALLLVQRIRDEAHRFALEYHRKLREKEKFNTSLRNIKGVGPAREKMLLVFFGGLAEVKRASEQALVKAGLDRITAKNVHDYYARQKDR